MSDRSQLFCLYEWAPVSRTRGSEATIKVRISHQKYEGCENIHKLIKLLCVFDSIFLHISRIIGFLRRFRPAMVTKGMFTYKTVYELIVIYCEVEEDWISSSTTTRRRMAEFKNSKLTSAFEVKVEGCLRY